MPRSGGRSGGRAPARPAQAPKRPAVAPQQPSRGASTAAHPPANTQQAQPAQQGRQPGIFGQMASTAAGVAVGSSIGHAIGGMFGSGSSAPAEQQQAENAVASQANNESNQNTSWGPRSCENDAKSFTSCLDQHQGNMQVCGWYLEQLKACQQAAKEY